MFKQKHVAYLILYCELFRKIEKIKYTSNVQHNGDVSQ